MNRKRTLLALTLGCLSLLGCGTEDGDLVDYDAEGIEMISQRLASAADIAHACAHARTPPGGSYIATSATLNATGGSPLWAEHSAYDVTLPSIGGGDYAGYGRFTADGSAEHGIYSDPSVSVTVRVRNANGTLGVQIGQVWTKTLTSSDCAASTNLSLPTYGTTPALSRVRTYNLVAGQAYYVRFTRNGSNKVLGIFENLEEQP